MYSLTAPVLPMRQRIAALETAMLASDEKVDVPIRHFHAQGLYGREATLKAGTLATGHIHAQEHICIISQGRCLVVIDDGTRELVAPATFIVPRGTKNCVFALEDTVWTTVHATDETDVEKLEATLTLPQYPDVALVEERVA